MEICARESGLNKQARITFSVLLFSTGAGQVSVGVAQPRKKVPPWRFFFFGVTEIRESMSVEYSEDGDIGDIGVSGAVTFCDILSGAGEVGGRPAGALCRDE